MTTIAPTFTYPSAALRKVAILIGSIDRSIAEALLNPLSPETQAEIYHLATELSDIDPQEREQVVADFLAGVESEDDTVEESAAVEVDDSLTRRLARHEDRSSSDQAENPHDYLPWRGLPARSIGQTLGAEHPQVVAVILAHLPPSQAAEVLGTLPPAMQTDVLKRIARAPQAAPELLREIVDLIETRLPWLDATGNAPEKGVAAARAILEAAHESLRAEWTSNLRGDAKISMRANMETEEFDDKLTDALSDAVEMIDEAHAVTLNVALASATAEDPKAEHPRVELPAPIQDLAQLLTWSDSQLAELLSRAEPIVVLLALASAPPDVAQKFQARLMPREARELARQMTRLGPWRLADAALATERLLQLATEMRDASQPTSNQSATGSPSGATRRGARWRVF